VRIIAGELRGRRLSVPRGRQTRPTPDRVREALFSALGALDEARVLDLYAGSGALGFEALSRGADYAVFVEHNRAALAALRENVNRLALAGRARILAVDATDALVAIRPHGPFDLIFVDPPYAHVATGRAIRPLERMLGAPGELLVAGGRLILEHAARDHAPELASLRLARSRRYGDTAVSTYEQPDRPGG